jgi:thioredoxin 1
MNKIGLILIASFWLLQACAQNPAIHTIDVKQFAEAIAQDTLQIIDVRTEDEYSGGHIAFSKNYDQALGSFTEQIKTLDKTKPVYIYCLSGGRSSNAAKRMASAGFANIYNLDGGILAWRGEAKPLVIDRPTQDPGLSLAEYKTQVASANKVLVEFYATWCVPCKVLKPTVEEIEKTYASNIKVIYIDVDKNKALADSLKIKSIPVLMAYNNGKKKWQTNGVMSKAEIIKKLKL